MDLVLGAMQDRGDHVPRAVPHRLNDELAEIGLEDVNASTLEGRVERNLF